MCTLQKRIIVEKKDESMSEPWKTLTMINIRGRSESLYKRIENFVLIDGAQSLENQTFIKIFFLLSQRIIEMIYEQNTRMITAALYVRYLAKMFCISFLSFPESITII